MSSGLAAVQLNSRRRLNLLNTAQSSELKTRLKFVSAVTEETQDMDTELQLRQQLKDAGDVGAVQSSIGDPQYSDQEAGITGVPVEGYLQHHNRTSAAQVHAHTHSQRIGDAISTAGLGLKLSNNRALATELGSNLLFQSMQARHVHDVDENEHLPEHQQGHEKTHEQRAGVHAPYERMNELWRSYPHTDAVQLSEDGSAQLSTSAFTDTDNGISDDLHSPPRSVLRANALLEEISRDSAEITSLHVDNEMLTLTHPTKSRARRMRAAAPVRGSGRRFRVSSVAVAHGQHGQTVVNLMSASFGACVSAFSCPSNYFTASLYTVPV